MRILPVSLIRIKNLLTEICGHVMVLDYVKALNLNSGFFVKIVHQKIHQSVGQPVCNLALLAAGP